MFLQAESDRNRIDQALHHAEPTSSASVNRWIDERVKSLPYFMHPIDSAVSRFCLFAAALLLLLHCNVDAGNSNSLMDISADGRYLACSNRDSGTVSIVDLRSHKKVFETEVGKKPEGVTFIGSGALLAVAVYGDDRVVVLDAEAGEQMGSVDVFDEPYGIVSNKSGSKLYVTLEYPGQVLEIDANTLQTIRSMSAGKFPRGIALTTDEQQLLVTEYYTSNVLGIDVATGSEVERWDAASTDNLCRQIAVHPVREKAYVPHIRSQVRAVHGAGSIFPYLTVLDTNSDKSRRRKRFPMDSFLRTLVVANPWEIALSPDGRQLYAIFSGTDDMFACDTLDDDYREFELREYIKLGHNPRAVRVSPDGTRFYIYNALDFNVVAYDTSNLEPVATIPVTGNPISDEVRRGKILFYSAQQPMVGRRWISCSSCHPDGDSDGRTWHNPEGLRATPPIFGLAWTHPLHWSADRDESQDFEHTIRGPLMQGRGLVRGRINDSLEEPNKGLSRELDALAAYTNSHKFSLSPHAKGGLSEAARRGQALFFSKETKCAECHTGPFYSDSNPATERLLHDVGTGNDDPSEIMGPAYDTPTLLGIYRSAPYLHHGRAETLHDVLTTFNTDDRHGTTSHLNAKQIDDLVEFLNALPFEDPEVDAKASGLVKVDR